MRRAICIVCVGMAGCVRPASPPANPARAASQPEAGTKPTVMIAGEEDGKPVPKEVVAAWMLYGLSIAGQWADLPPEQKAQRRPHDFASELKALDVVAEHWETSDGPKTADAYLDDLVEVRRQKLMAEYLLDRGVEPGWTIPAEAIAKLDVERYRGFSEQRLARHKVQRYARIKVPEGEARPIPGLALSEMDPDPHKRPCRQLMPELRKAAKTWQAEAAKLPLLPLAAVNRRLLTVLGMSAAEIARRGGVLLVPQEVRTVMFVAGFCANDLGEFAEAERHLRAAVALDPALANMRGELVHAIMQQRRMEDAEREVEVALELPANRCIRAGLLRRKGFILFELGRLLDAYVVCTKSLELQPGHEGALRELELITNLVKKRGGGDERKLKDLPPIPWGESVVNDCPE